MFRKLVLVLGLFSFSNFAAAQWVGGVGYFNLTADIDDIEVTPDVFSLSLGYKFETTMPDLTITPSISLYGDANNDDVIVATPEPARMKVDADNGLGIDVHFQWEGDGPLYFYLAPNLARFNIRGKEGGIKLEYDDWEAGIGVGIGLNVTDRIGVELSFDEYGDSDILGISLRYDF